jgi:cell division septation protein DedD
VQVAALRDAARARALVDALKASGYPAYLVEPAPSDPKGLVRIRVGRFQTASEAEAVKARLQKQRPEKLWVTREPR